MDRSVDHHEDIIIQVCQKRITLTVVVDKTCFGLIISGRGGGGYGFRRQNDNNDEERVEVLKDTIFIQNLPKNVTRDDIQEAFSSVGPIRVNMNTSAKKKQGKYCFLFRLMIDQVVQKFGSIKIA